MVTTTLDKAYLIRSYKLSGHHGGKYSHMSMPRTFYTYKIAFATSIAVSFLNLPNLYIRYCYCSYIFLQPTLKNYTDIPANGTFLGFCTYLLVNYLKKIQNGGARAIFYICNSIDFRRLIPNIQYCKWSVKLSPLPFMLILSLSIFYSVQNVKKN